MIWVQLCGKNRYKVTILIMHKRMRGNWVFIDMINGGLLALPMIHGLNGGLLLRGWSPSRRHCYRIKHQQEGATLNVNAQAHDVVVHDVIVSVLCKIQFQWSLLHLKCKFNLHMLFKLTKLQMPMFVLYKPSWHVCDMPLMFKWWGLHCNGSNWNSIWI